MPNSQEIARVMAEMDRFNQTAKMTVTEERYEKRVASVGGSYGGLTALLQQGAPGNWASDHKSEAEKFQGWHYVAISSIGKAVRSANCEAYQEKVREYAKAYNEQDDDSEPLPKWHPLMKLLKRPNPSQSGASFREEVSIQLCLTGSALIWNVPNQMGRTVERYVIPTAIAEPRQPEPGRPRGGWYINPEVARWQIESGWFLYTGLATAIGKVIDARDVQVIRFIHPVFKDEGQSPVSAGALWTDTSEKVDVSRHSHLRNGSDPSVIIGIDGVEDEGTLQRMSAKFNEKYAGPSKHGKAMFVNGQNVKVEPVTRTPAEMAYEGAFVQFRDAIMALHGVTPIAAGIEAPSGDDGLYAPLKQFISGTVQPILDLMAEEDTEQLAGQFGEGISVLYTAKAIDDAKLTEQQINTDIAAGAIEVDEIRKLRGRKPWGGDKGKAVAGQGAKEEAKPGLPVLAQGVPGLEPKPNGLEPQTGSQALDPSKPPQGTPDPMKLAEEAVAKALGGFADRLSALLKTGDNCGTGAGGFKPGNDCAGGGDGGNGGDKPAKKKRKKKVAEESSGPKIEVFERGAGELEFTSRGELIRGRIGDLPITEGEAGLIGKLSKKTRAGIESAMTDPDILEDMKAGGIEALNVEATNYYQKKTGRKANWSAAYYDGVLTIHPKTVDTIESSAIQEKKDGGLKRVISHEAGHGVYENARDDEKKAFAEALKKNPEIVDYVSRMVSVAANPNAFSDTGSRVVTESFAEIHALRRYNREMYDSLPEDIRKPVESARKYGLELSEHRVKWRERLKPKWQKSGSSCGANAQGGGGFQPGNTCGKRDGKGGESAEGGGKDATVNPKILAWAKEKFGDNTTAENFAKWFGDSKVVDANGNPLVVYHGTSAEFDTFDESRLGQSTGHPLSKLGFYFSSEKVADRFTRDFTGAGDFADPEKLPVREGAKKLAAFVSMSNPYIISAEDFRNKLTVSDTYDDEYGFSVTPKQMQALREKLKADGHDGIIVKRNARKSPGTEEWDSENYIVFTSPQIKSATGNSGAFDPKDPNITKSAASDSYNPPESARNNARKVLRWKEQHGDSVRGMTATGWARANQLASGEKLSRETVGRMAAFARHRKNSKVDPKFQDEPWRDAGYVAWLGWGGDSGINWAAGVIAGEGKSGSGCGANAEGGGGFQPGNTCGSREGGADSVSWYKQKEKERILGTIEKAELPARLKGIFSKDMAEAIDAMPEAVAARLNGVKEIKWAMNTTRLAEALRADGEEIPEGITPAGAWDVDNQRLYLAANSYSSGKSGTYKHELAHVVDYNNGALKFSSSDEWKSAWQDELSGQQLTRYASTNSEEGFAEFARFAWGQRDWVKKKFPKSAAFFEKRGLL